MKLKLIMAIGSPRIMRIVARNIHDFLNQLTLPGRQDAGSSHDRDLQRFLSWTAESFYVEWSKTMFMGINIHYALQPGKIRNHAQDPGCKNDQKITKRNPWNLCVNRKEVYNG